MSEAVDIPKVKIDPIGCYTQALELVKGDYWLLLGVSVVGILVGGAVPIVLIGPMMCGVYLCFLEKYRGREFDFALLFKGFDYFAPGVIAALIMTGVAMLAMIPVFAVMFAGIVASVVAAEAEGAQSAVPAIASAGTMVVSSLLTVVLIMAVNVFFFFTFQLIVDRGLSGTEAITTSARAVARNFAGVLGLTLIGLALGLVGVLACYVGTFFILPISFAAMTIAYRKLFPEAAADPTAVTDGAALPEPSV